MKHILILTLLLELLCGQLLLTPVQAETFQRVYTSRDNMFARQLVRCSNGDFLALVNRPGVSLLRVDSLGEARSIKKLDLQGGDQACGILLQEMSSDSCIVVFSSKSKEVTLAGVAAVSRDGIVRRQFGVPLQGLERPSLAALLPDGSVAIAGCIEEQGNFMQVYLSRISINGNIIYSKKLFGSCRYSFPSKLISYGGNDVLLIGESECGHNSISHCFITKVDESGEEIWSKSYNDRNLAAFMAKDGGCVLSSFSSPKGEGKRGETVIFKVDSVGKEIWRRNFPADMKLDTWDYRQDVFHSGLETTNGDYLLVGSYALASAPQGDQITIARLSHDGELKWRQHFGERYFRGQVVLKQGLIFSCAISAVDIGNGAVILGHTGSTDNHSNLWLCAVDSLGRTLAPSAEESLDDLERNSKMAKGAKSKGLSRGANIDDVHNITERWDSANKLEFSGDYSGAARQYQWIVDSGQTFGSTSDRISEARAHLITCRFLAKRSGVAKFAAKSKAPSSVTTKKSDKTKSPTPDTTAMKAQWGFLRDLAASVAVAGGLTAADGSDAQIQSALQLLDQWSASPLSGKVEARNRFLTGMVSTLVSIILENKLGIKVNSLLTEKGYQPIQQWPDANYAGDMQEEYKALPPPTEKRYEISKDLTIVEREAEINLTGEWECEEAYVSSQLGYSCSGFSAPGYTGETFSSLIRITQSGTIIEIYQKGTTSGEGFSVTTESHGSGSLANGRAQIRLTTNNGYQDVTLIQRLEVISSNRIKLVPADDVWGVGVTSYTILKRKS